MTHYADNLKKSIVATQGRITQMIHDDNEQTNAAYREAIIRMAREADSGFEGGPDADGTLADSLVGLYAIERFAALVAAEAVRKEREACALFLESGIDLKGLSPGIQAFIVDLLMGCAAAIRKRGET